MHSVRRYFLLMHTHALEGEAYLHRGHTLPTHPQDPTYFPHLFPPPHRHLPARKSYRAHMHHRPLSRVRTPPSTAHLILSLAWRTAKSSHIHLIRSRIRMPTTTLTTRMTSHPLLMSTRPTTLTWTMVPQTRLSLMRTKTWGRPCRRRWHTRHPDLHAAHVYTNASVTIAITRAAEIARPHQTPLLALRVRSWYPLRPISHTPLSVESASNAGAVRCFGHPTGSSSTPNSNVSCLSPCGHTLGVGGMMRAIQPSTRQGMAHGDLEGMQRDMESAHMGIVRRVRRGSLGGKVVLGQVRERLGLVLRFEDGESLCSSCSYRR